MNIYEYILEHILEYILEFILKLLKMYWSYKLYYNDIF